MSGSALPRADGAPPRAHSLPLIISASTTGSLPPGKNRAYLSHSGLCSSHLTRRFLGHYQLLRQASSRRASLADGATYLQVIQPVRLLAALIRVRLGGVGFVLAID